MDGDLETAERYLERAKELREIATKMADDTGREILTSVADDYERMARQFVGINRTDRIFSDRQRARASD